MEHTEKCHWCENTTTKSYPIEDNIYLCVECAKKHYKIVQLETHRKITLLEQDLIQRRDMLQKFIYDSCDHSDIIKTGYVIGFGDEAREQCNCKICGKTIYMKPFIG